MNDYIDIDPLYPSMMTAILNYGWVGTEEWVSDTQDIQEVNHAILIKTKIDEVHEKY